MVVVEMLMLCVVVGVTVLLLTTILGSYQPIVPAYHSAHWTEISPANMSEERIKDFNEQLPSQRTPLRDDVWRAVYD